MNIFDWWYGSPKLVEQGKTLDAQRQPIVDSYQPGGYEYNKIAAQRGKDAADFAARGVMSNNATSQTEYQFNQPLGGDYSSGLGGLFSSVFGLVAIGFVVWLFVEFGGLGIFKHFGAKSNWFKAAVIGGTLVICYFIYKQFVSVKDSASNAADQLGKNFKSIFN